MYLLGHLGVTAALYVLARRASPRRLDPALVGLLALVMLPDVDRFVSALTHRGLTHTVWFAALLGLVVGAFVAVASADRTPNRVARRALRGFCVGAGAVVAHLAGDVLTPVGVRPFAPLYAETWTLSLFYAADPRANAALLVAGAALVAGRRGVAAVATTPIRRLRGGIRHRAAGGRRDP